MSVELNSPARNQEQLVKSVSQKDLGQEWVRVYDSYGEAHTIDSRYLEFYFVQGFGLTPPSPEFELPIE